jgi:hypothetical protein
VRKVALLNLPMSWLAKANPEAARSFADRFVGKLWIINASYRYWMKKAVLAKGYTSAKLEQMSTQAGF